MNILEDYYNPSVLHHEHSYSASGVYHQIQPTYDLNVSLPAGALNTLRCWVGGGVAPALQQLLFMDYPIPQR